MRPPADFRLSADQAAELGLVVRVDGDDGDPQAPTTWTPIDLRGAVEGNGIPPPELWRRTDGECFLYRDRVHWFQGESETCKSWAAQSCVAEVLLTGGRVLYIDYEDDEHGLAEHLKALGVPDEMILERFVYIRPDEPLTGKAQVDLSAALEGGFDLVVVDGVTEAMTTEGLEIISNSDAAKWLRLLPKRITRLVGAAVVCIDHTARSAGAEEKYAIGAQHKRAGITGTAYRFTTIRPLSRPVAGEPVHGLFDVAVTKDRPGYVRRHAAMGDKIGTFSIESYPDGTVRADLVPPGETGPDHVLVAAILQHLTYYDGSSKNKIEEAVEGKRDRIRDALRWMAEADLIRIEQSGNTHRHYLTEKGREKLEEEGRD